MSDERYFRQAKRGVFYNRSTGAKYTDCWFLIDECKLEDKVEMDPFEIGGEQVDTAAKSRKMKVSAKAGSYANGILERLVNATVTTISANADGEIVSSANVQGDSVYDSETGIASIGISDSSDLINASIVITSLSASTVSVNIYNETIDYTSDALTITTGAVTSTGISTYGIYLTGGSGTIGFTIGDTMTAEMHKPSYEGETIFVDGNMDFDEVGMKLYPAPHNNNFAYIDCFRVKPGGQEFSIADGWSTYTIEADLLFDEDKGTAGGYYQIKRLRPEE